MKSKIQKRKRKPKKLQGQCKKQDFQHQERGEISKSIHQSVPEIPGYYYDHEKGKYFRLNPNCVRYLQSRETPLSSVVTTQEDLDFSLTSSSSSSSSSTSSLSTTTTTTTSSSSSSATTSSLSSKLSTSLRICTKQKNEKLNNHHSINCSLFQQIFKREINFTSPKQVQQNSIETLIKRRDCRQKLEIIRVKNHMLKCHSHLTFNPLSNDVIGSDDNFIQICKIDAMDSWDEMNLPEAVISEQYQTTSQVKSIHYSAKYDRNVVSLFGNERNGGEIIIKGGGEHSFKRIFGVKNKNIFSTALYDNILSICSANCSFLTDMNCIQTKKIFNCSSDVFCQAFANSPSIIYSGFRNGNLGLFDTRNQYKNGHKSVDIIWKNCYPITHIQVMPFDPYKLIISTSGGSVSQFDLRNHKFIVEYEFIDEMTKKTQKAKHLQVLYPDLHVRMDPMYHRYLCVSGYDTSASSNKCKIFDIKSGDCLRQIQINLNDNNDMVWIGDSSIPKLIFGGSKDHNELLMLGFSKI